MREVSAAMTEAWLAPDKTGDRRPVVRATIQRANVRRYEYDTAKAPGGDFETTRHRVGRFANFVMGSAAYIVELRNIKTFQWTRSVNQDIAEATLVLQNAEVTPMGNLDESSINDDFEQPGEYTFSRGEPGHDPNPWGYPEDSAWAGLIVPDRLVKTYEGYGINPDVWPHYDENLVQSGTWLIDEVNYNTDGTITIKMRDIGRLLLDQIVFPPNVPHHEYPLEWSKIRTEPVQGRDATGGHWHELTRADGGATSSNSYYIGEGLTNPPYDSYVQANGGFNGHHPNHVLEEGDGYWQSTGQISYRSKVWWQMNLDSNTAVNAIRLRPQGGPYRVYISIHNGEKWLGRKTIPYDVTTEGIDVEADIPYITTVIADKNITFDCVLPRVYGSANKIRITFGRLQDTQVGDYPFRAGLRNIHIYTAASAGDLGFAPGTFLKSVGNYRDFTDIVKWVGAWNGWFWPEHFTGDDRIKAAGVGYDPESPEWFDVTFYSPDPVLPRGRTWGDFMNTGTAGEADLTVDLFDKQPMLDIINYIRDIVAYNFWIDETGGMVWRLPNIWDTTGVGNYLSPTQLGVRGHARTTEVITIDDETILLDYSTNLSSRNLRERIFVASTTGKIGTVIKGYIPYPVGFRRIAGWTDQHFNTRQECRVMADMIAARTMFDYRRGHARIPGYPAIQIDDQIRIFERVTNETYYHYVESISSNIDMGTGTWTYDLETHWLGEHPEDAWVVKVDQLDAVTQGYLSLAGA